MKMRLSYSGIMRSRDAFAHIVMRPYSRACLSSIGRLMRRSYFNASRTVQKLSHLTRLQDREMRNGSSVAGVSIWIILSGTGSDVFENEPYLV